MKFIFKLIAVSLVCGITIASPAAPPMAGAQPSAAGRKTSPCTEDVTKYCSKLDIQNKPVIRECLAKNFDKVSAACIAHAQKSNPCQADSLKLCADKNPFGNNADCLTAKLASLSPACMRLYKSTGPFDAACESDLAKVCPTAKDRISISNCLMPALAKLSNKCKSHLESTPCVKDWKKLCAKSKELPYTCMDQNQSKLSKSCIESRASRLGIKK
jgi:hypothetical protein